MLNKKMQKVIASGIALLITLTALFGAAWAILSTEKVGLTVNVSFDSAVTAKVYLSTDSSSADTYKQPNLTVTAENFAKANSALVLDTYQGTALTKNEFEALGAGNGLKCDANGEMEFYVYVENYSTTESVYYRANIDLVGTGEQTAPFSTVTNPSFETCEFATELVTPTINLLTFKIKSTNTTGFNANAIQIKIELFNSIYGVLNINFGKYTSDTYINKYYIEMGSAPQSYAGTSIAGDDYLNATLTEPSKTWIDGNNYYNDTTNPNIQYVLNGEKYYLVEPIRWIILADERYTGIAGTLGVDYYSTTSLATKDRTSLSSIPLNQIVVVSEKLITNFLFTGNHSNRISHLRSLRDKIFTANEKALLKTVSLATMKYESYPEENEDFSIMAGFKSSKENFYVSNYLTTPALNQASRTAYLAGITTNPSNYSEWWLRSYYYPGGSNYESYYINTSGVKTSQRIGFTSGSYLPRDIRPIFVVTI